MLLLGGDAQLGLERADAGVRALERFVLHQDGLHQGVSRIGGLAQPILDGAFGLRIARGIFKRCEAIKQFADQIASLNAQVTDSQNSAQEAKAAIAKAKEAVKAAAAEEFVSR